MLTIQGLEVNLTDAYLSSSCSTSKLAVEVSWNAGGSWSTVQTTPNLGTNTSNGDYPFGASNSTASWGSHTWTRDNFSDANFRVRLSAQKGCSQSNRQLRLDMLQVRVSWKLVPRRPRRPGFSKPLASPTHNGHGPCVPGVLGRDLHLGWRP